MAFLFAVANSPNLVPSTQNPDWSLTIYNARSSEKTLGVMLLIACVGMTFVLSYTAVVYWVFCGRVKLGHTSY